MTRQPRKLSPRTVEADRIFGLLRRGQVLLLGLKELIKYKGFQVASAELEDLLLRHPKILDPGVVGLPDPPVEEKPVAFVVKKRLESASNSLKVTFPSLSNCTEVCDSWRFCRRTRAENFCAKI